MLLKTPMIYSRYHLPPNPGYKNDEPSMTQQQFKDEADINNIMARYQKTGVLVDPLTQTTRKPMFDDFSELGDFREHQQAVIEAQDMFMQLPSQLRARFANDPAELLQWLSDPANKDEAMELGLMTKPPEMTPEMPLKPEVSSEVVKEEVAKG
nr:MAG TPA: Scaffold protein [Microviridae sp.]